MKKGLLVTGLLLAMATTAQANDYFTVRVAGDFNSEYKGEGPLEHQDIGMGIYVEYMKPLNRHFEVGAGIGFEKHTNLEATISDDYWRESGTNRPLNRTDVLGYKDYYSIPMYATGKLVFNPESRVKVYAKGEVGLSINLDAKVKRDTTFTYRDTNTTHSKEHVSADINTENGLYAGIGLGMEFNNLTLDIMQKVNRTKLTVDELNIKESADYTRTTVTVGYKF